jgi:hypothetical protein
VVIGFLKGCDQIQWDGNAVILGIVADGMRRMPALAFMVSCNRLMTGVCLAGMLIKSGDDISDEIFNLQPRQVTAHGANCISNQRMVLHRAQPCNGQA